MLTNFMPLRFCSSANKNYNSSEMQMCVNIKKKKKIQVWYSQETGFICKSDPFQSFFGDNFIYSFILKKNIYITFWSFNQYLYWF